MKPIQPPEIIKFYQLVKMTAGSTGLYLNLVGTPHAPNVGIGFFTTLQEAEHSRTLEVLKDTGVNNTYHIFEVEFPNPIVN
jgi:hypothetical protein